MIPKHSKYLARFMELYERIGKRFEVMDDKLWVSYQRMVVPVGPPHLDYSLPEEQTSLLLRLFPECIMARYTTGFEENSLSPWYTVICKNFIDISELSSKDRNKLKKGISNCWVERIDAKYLYKHGYEVYISAYERYRGNPTPLTQKEFKESSYLIDGFDDTHHYWGVFHNNKFIAYALNTVYGDIAVDYSTMKYNPEYLRLRSAEALVYTMNKYYLNEQSFMYVNDGFRSIFHPTNVQDFLIRKFGFKKAHTSLNILYKPIFSLYMFITFPLRGILGRMSSKMNALYLLEEIHRESRERWAK